MLRARYLPDFLYAAGRLEAGRALCVDAQGRVTHSSDLEGPLLRLPGKALLPGLVNAHSHAFQRALRGCTEFVPAGRKADDFWSWRELMYRTAAAVGPEELRAISRQAFLEMALAGITTVGEFHYLHRDPRGNLYADPSELARQVIGAARDVGLRIVLLRVGYARAGFGVPPNPRQLRFLDPNLDTYLTQVDLLRKAEPAVHIGLAPHSVRAVPKEWLEQLGAWKDGPLHIHVAEQPAELEACLAEHGRRPVQLLADLGLLSERFTAVHAIHLDDAEVRALGQARATVCACPSTERNLGDGVVPADALAAAGAHLALGTDSQATIDLLEDARELELHLRLVRQRRAVLDPGTGSPDGLAKRLLEFATAAGARSLGLSGGSLELGAPADFFTVDLDHPSVRGAPEEALLPAVVFGAEKAAIRDVAVQGRFVIRDGHHPRAAEFGQAYSAAVRRSL